MLTFLYFLTSFPLGCACRQEMHRHSPLSLTTLPPPLPPVLLCIISCGHYLCLPHTGPFRFCGASRRRRRWRGSGVRRLRAVLVRRWGGGGGGRGSAAAATATAFGAGDRWRVASASCCCADGGRAGAPSVSGGQGEGTGCCLGCVGRVPGKMFRGHVRWVRFCSPVLVLCLCELASG